MKVFISWSGSRSRQVAAFLRTWLPDVLQSINPWMSDSDIEAGMRWSRELEEQLAATRFGILCVTPENVSTPWLMFEAGALAKTVRDTYVCPYLIELTPSLVPSGPLTQFQAKQATKDETWDLVRTINGYMGNVGLSEERLERQFVRCWPDLAEKLGNLPEPSADIPAERTMEAMIAEILELVRSLERRANRGVLERLVELLSSTVGVTHLIDALESPQKSRSSGPMKASTTGPSQQAEAGANLLDKLLTGLASAKAQRPESRGK